MIHIERLKAAGLTPEKLKPLFTAEVPSAAIKSLVDSIRNRLRAGIDTNIRDYRIYWAIDRAFDSPFYQVAYTQMMGLIDANRQDDKKVLSQLKDWGLTHLLPDVIDPKTGRPCCGPDNKPMKAVNIPVFFNIYVPLVVAYMVVRWGKLFNDRNLVPLYKYEPAKFTNANRMRCEIITELVARMGNLYDYRSDERQAIFQTLLYGACLKFPREAWHQVYQEDAAGKKKLVKEGLRFNMPHPSRMYWDMFHRASTLNTGTGCRYAGYWEIQSYKEVRSNKLYWNTDKITFGVHSWFSAATDFFSTVYPCVMQLATGPHSSTQGAGPLDRENAASYYTQDNDDSGTLISQHIERVIPAEVGMGDYEYPVTMRFVMANDGAVLWAEPLASDIIPTYLYDADQNRSRQRSLAFEVLPFQDLISQIISQWTLSVRQNLINPIFYDESMVPAEVISELKNLGEKMLRTRTFIPFDSTENVRFGQTQREAFFSPQITHHNTAELATLVKGVLDVLDRILVLSSQEIGQSAPHEQTAEEIRTISHTTSTRLDFTGSFIDDGIFATKRVLYDSLIAYGHKEFNASISNSYGTEEEFNALIDKLKLALEDESAADSIDGKVTVTGTKDSIELVDFASSRDAANRIDNPGVAAAMAQIFQAVANNPVLIQTLGAPQLIDLLNQVIAVSGLPKEFKLKAVNPAPNTPEGQQQEQQALQEQLLGLTKQIKAAIDKSAQETLAASAQMVQPIVQQVQQAQQATQVEQQAIQQLAQKDQQQDQALVEITQAIQRLSQIVEAAANRPAMNPMVQPMSPEEMAAQQLVPPETSAQAPQPI